MCQRGARNLDCATDAPPPHPVSLLPVLSIQHEGTETLDLVHSLRDGFAELRREGDPRAEASLLRTLEGLEPMQITQVIRALGSYAALLNVVDEAHAQSRRRAELIGDTENAGVTWPASWDETMKEFQAAGMTRTDVESLMASVEFLPVFTAHPTEARRYVVLKLLSRVYALCGQWLAREIPDRVLMSKMAVEVETLWLTDEMRSRKPAVLDEINAGLNYFRLSLFSAVPEVYRAAQRSIAKNYGSPPLMPAADGSAGDPDKADSLSQRLSGLCDMPDGGLATCMKFGSWIGGDRDGNPFVYPETTVLASLLASRTAIGEYITRLRDLQGRLLHSKRFSKTNGNLSERLLANDADFIAKIPAFEDPTYHADEPYRAKLKVMRHRMEQRLRLLNQNLYELNDTVAEESNNSARAKEVIVDIEYNIDPVPGLEAGEDQYGTPEELLADLKLIQEALLEGGDVGAASGPLQDLIRLVETFGFRLQALDVRQESTRHIEAVDELLRALGVCDDYAALDEDGRVAVLEAALQSSPPDEAALSAALEKCSNDTRQSVEVLEAVATVSAVVGDEAVGEYNISMARTASNVLEVLTLGWAVGAGLAEKTGAGDEEWSAKLRVSPLFETIPDLEGMPDALERLLASKVYRSYLKAAGDCQDIMIGYSDSAKDGGIMQSAFSLYRAQRSIQTICETAGCRWRIFHGRGGTVGRGAGPAHESIMAQPAGSVDGTIKFTEQGETVTYKYGNANTATYELGVGLTGLLKASAPSCNPPLADEKSFMATMSELAALGEKAYRGLTDDTEGFYDYYYSTTICYEIGLMNIGSRPAKRKSGDRTKASLRAIPWVFGWAQCRVTLPAWYGVGSALRDYIGDDAERLAEVRDMYARWPFFKNFLANVQQSLVKANMEIAEEYSQICEDRITASLVFCLIKSEYESTVEQIIRVSGETGLLGAEPELKEKLDDRNLFLDPLNAAQVILLGRRRRAEASGDEEEIERWQDPLLRSIKSIAQAMRNTG